DVPVRCGPWPRTVQRARCGSSCARSSGVDEAETVVTGPSGDCGRYLHPNEARMAAWRRVYERYLVVDDIYPAIADRFVAAGVTRLAELGGGRGPVAALTA